MTMPGLRKTYFLSWLAALAALGCVYYLEIYQGLDPCPLCILQRVALIALSVVFCLGFLFRAGNAIHYVISAGGLLASGCGWAIAARQVWLQYSPTAIVGDCSVSLNYMLQTFPFKEVLQKLFQSNADCATIGWNILGISLAGWSLLFFSLLCGVMVRQAYRSYLKRH